jgi:hypothetical protein
MDGHKIHKYERKIKKCIFVIGSESFIASFWMSHTQTMLDGK